MLIIVKPTKVLIRLVRLKVFCKAHVNSEICKQRDAGKKFPISAKTIKFVNYSFVQTFEITFYG